MKTPRVLPLALVTAVVLSGTLTATAASAQAGVRPRIQGVVVDQGGRHVDDVQVRALNRHGDPVASALTYASAREDGPQHGYFYLAVGGAGRYDVVLSKPGYRSADLGEQVVGRRGVVSLGEVVLEKKLAPSTTRVSLDDRTLTTGQRATANVRVRTDETSRPVGEVSLRVDGDEVRSVDLVGSDRGSLDVRLPRLARGEHKVKAVWTSTSVYVRGSTSEPVTVVVRRASSRGGDRVAARAWLPGSPLLRLQR